VRAGGALRPFIGAEGAPGVAKVVTVDINGFNTIDGRAR
jgi:hypothetical protein